MRWIKDDGQRAKKGGGTTPQMGDVVENISKFK
jgi:hypothetical protein